MSQGEFNVDLRLPAGTPLEVTDRRSSRVQTCERAAAGSRPRLRRRRHRQSPRRQSGRCRREHRPRQHHARPRCKRARTRSARCAQLRELARADAGRAASVQPPEPVRAVDAARGRDHGLRPRAPGVRPPSGVHAQHARDAAVPRRALDRRGRQSRDPDRVRPGARDAARPRRARHRRPRRAKRARRSRDALPAATTRRSTCSCAASTRARRRSKRSAT